MKLRTKLKCTQVARTDYQAEIVNLEAVYSNDPESVNQSFARATPLASFEITIDNPTAQGLFNPGDEYFVDASPISGASNEPQVFTYAEWEARYNQVTEVFRDNGGTREQAFYGGQVVYRDANGAMFIMNTWRRNILTPAAGLEWRPV